MQNGKGDKRRPMQVPYEQYAKNWEAAFGKKSKRKKPKKEK